MPELPEVEIVKQSLKKTVKLKKIKQVLIKNYNLRFKIQKNLTKKLRNEKILNIKRKSKYLIFHLTTSKYLIVHFGMSGTLHLIKKNKKKINTNLSFYSEKNLPKKHNHVEILFDNFKLIYNDPRRFGFIILLSSNQKFLNFFKKLGLEPLDIKFNYKYLKNKIFNRKKNIKNILLDQSIVSGLGNIYVNEILNYSKVNPKKHGSQLNDNEIKLIIKYSKLVIKKAIIKGGSSIRDFKSSKGQKGSYQNEFRAYDRHEKECLNKYCNGMIERIFITNRSTFFCKKCQK